MTKRCGMPFKNKHNFLIQLFYSVFLVSTFNNIFLAHFLLYLSFPI